jgi:hypothetical protein
MPQVKRVFWDIETSPNVGFHWSFGKQYLGHDNIIHEGQIMCICWKEQGKKKVHSLTWDPDSASPIGVTDLYMVAEFKKVIDEADELVAQFGDNFDLPWYNARHLVHGLPPVNSAKTADTYKMGKRHLRLNCHKLDYLASLLFGEHKIKTTFEWWRNCHPLTNPDPDSRAKWLAKMVRYCKKDVVLLERVWEYLAMYDPPGTHAGVFLRGDQFYKWTCPRCASESVIKSKTRVTAKGTIQHQMKCKECGGYYVISNADFRRYQEDNHRR